MYLAEFLFLSLISLFVPNSFHQDTNETQAVGADSLVASQPVDFDRDILPIFRDRCFSCHSSRRIEGDFRLDDEALARKGGHTGQLVFGDSSATSELYNRIISTESGYQMPKKGLPLNPEQIGLIKAWLDQGSRWGQAHNAVLSKKAETAKPIESDSKKKLSVLEQTGEFVLNLNQTLSQPTFKYFGLVGWLGLGLSLLIVVRLMLLRNGKNASDLKKRMMKILSWRLLLILLLAVVGVGIIQFQRGRIDELKKEVEKVTQASRKQLPIVVTTDRKKLVLPASPQHPPRLGGEYYRGNDERDPELFNGGFYRTATLRVHLIDSAGKRLEWGSPISTDDSSDASSGPLAIELVILRAPGTTMKLFDDQVFAETQVRRFRETELLDNSPADESEPLRFEKAIPEKEWRLVIPLEKTETWSGKRNAGVAYVFYGSQLENGLKGRAHYGIRFDIRIEDDKISDQSQIWMGSMYDLGGRVLVPQNGEILLDHWFDFRPIPEIEGGNTEDRALLGIPEHEDE